MGGSAHGQRGRKRPETDAVSASQSTSKRFLGREDSALQLLPGILDEVTLNFVTPKLPWIAFYVLASVSQGWKWAIRSGEVHNARVRAEGTGTVAVIEHISTGATTRALGLYSGKDKLVHKLPPIPNVHSGILLFSKCISLHGKIFVIGGEGEEYVNPGVEFCIPPKFALDDVYVLDLARQRPWEKCKSMVYARIQPWLGVVDGKIYVLGGRSYHEGPAVTVTEVYDPLSDTWSPLEFSLIRQNSHQVSAIGEKLFIYEGDFSSEYEMMKEDSRLEETGDVEFARFSEIYHIGKMAWRKGDLFYLTRNVEGVHFENAIEAVSFDNTVFLHQGQLHRLTWQGIVVYDMGIKSWTAWHLHAESLSYLQDDLVGVRCWHPVGFSHRDIDHGVLVSRMSSSSLVSNNEVVTLVCNCSGGRGGALLCSIGFGPRKEFIQWQIVECPFELHCEGIFPLQL